MIAPHFAGLLEQYFTKILVLTLDRAKDRQDRIRRILKNVDYEFFTGVDKNNLDVEILGSKNVYDAKKARKMNRQGKEMIPGQIACSLSHRQIYQHIIDKNFERVLVFEDDIVPLPENLKHLPDTLKELPHDWELVYLGYKKNEEITRKVQQKQAFYKLLSRVKLTKLSPTMVNNLLPVYYSPHLKIAGDHDCTHAYAITPLAARKLIDIQTPVAFNADNLLSYAVMNGHLKAFVTHPKFFDQENMIDPQVRSFVHQ